MSKLEQAILGSLAVGIFGFTLSIVWGTLLGRMSKDTAIFLAMLFGGIALLGILLHFVM